MVIEGGKPLAGEVTVSGSKNAALPMICAALLAPGRSSFYDVPDLADIRTLGRLLSHMGARVQRADGARRGPTEHAHTLHVDASEIGRPAAPYELGKTMRAGVLG